MVQPPLVKSFDIEPNNSDGDTFDEEACVIRDTDDDIMMIFNGSSNKNPLHIMCSSHVYEKDGNTDRGAG